MLDYKPGDTRIEHNHRLREDKDDKMVDKGMYQRLAGRLIDIPHTRIDIVYVVSVISLFMHNPRE